jgi:lipoate-protein ligase A
MAGADGRPWRLWIDPPADGPTNMAIDSAMLEALAPAAPATLRLYRWAPATLSLGAFQKYADRARQPAEIAALPVVRRITGGGAILHADELTYSLALPAEHELAQLLPAELYTWMHQRIASAVAALGGASRIKGDGAASARSGPFLCFACHGRFDLIAGADAKLAGSAQRRTRQGVLQHGSVVLRRSHPAQPSAALEEILPWPATFEQLADRLIAALAEAGVAVGEPAVSRVDPARLAEHRARFASDEWTRRR